MFLLLMKFQSVSKHESSQQVTIQSIPARVNKMNDFNNCFSFLHRQRHRIRPFLATPIMDAAKKKEWRNHPGYIINDLKLQC